MSALAGSTQLTANFESFRNLCVCVCELKLTVHFLDSECPTSITFTRLTDHQRHRSYGLHP